MDFNKNCYNDKWLKNNDDVFGYRAYTNLLFADSPSDAVFHRMNIYAPLVYFEGGSVNGYSLKTAPIFMPNAVGGYLSGKIEEPSCKNSIGRALQHGYIVVSPAIRGRTLKDKNGRNYGKAPACIVDYKAAVRYLRRFAENIPGDTDKIITNGTSAGGALSCLMGVSGNHRDYERYLNEIGAAKESDSVFASSCYCPITNLDHADCAYEWQFSGIYERRNDFLGRLTHDKINLIVKNIPMNEFRIEISKELCSLFPEYVNSLNLKDENGSVLSLDENGGGSFKNYIKSIVLSSAQNAIESGFDLSDKQWLEIKNGAAADMSFEAYARDIGRMKNAPAFDDVTMKSFENSLFGDEVRDFAHFTEFSRHRDASGGIIAKADVIKMMNPMYYIGDDGAQSAKYFRIRYGEKDRDTSLAISAILALKLRENNCTADYCSPWNIPHSGDYDLDELFDWIDCIVK